MGFKTGVLIGFATGYVMGTEAGRERYEQLRRTFDTAMRSETAKSLQGGLQGAWQTAQQEFPAAAQVASVLRDEDAR
ncbi:hypothetical protein [Euzebya sp.]|uniref:hypothetical protein n=1 Tax=Euzebya sp. TaxID=1971409 RepID=UPI00351502DC